MKRHPSLLSVCIIVTLLLMFFPVITTFNEISARVAQTTGIYHVLQSWVVPTEVRTVAAILSPLSVSLAIHGSNAVMVNGNFAHITWNCIGWQSLLLFLLTVIVGIQGNYTRASKIESVLLGLLGTYLVNLVRMAATIALYAYNKPVFALISHTVVAIVVSFLWFVGFWWFAYAWVLEPREEKTDDDAGSGESPL